MKTILSKENTKLYEFMNQELPISMYACRLILLTVFFYVSELAIVILSIITLQNTTWMLYWFGCLSD